MEKDRLTQLVLNQILRLSLEVESLEEYLNAVLRTITQIPWLAPQEKGAIFLFDPETQKLILKASHNFPEEQRRTCQRVPLGTCLCGEVAKTKKFIFADRVDARHTLHYPGMEPHGHYCIPILYEEEVLGVLNLFVPEGHKYDPDEETFLTGIAATIAGVIQRKQTETAQRESEELFRTLASTIVAGVFVYQGERLVYVNRACEEISGYSAEELLNMKFWEVVHPDFQEIVRQRGLARQRGEHVPGQYELKILRKDGTERWVVFTAGRIQWKGQPAVVGTAYDITDRKRTEQVLQESEERFRSIFENATVGIYRTTPDGKILMANPRLVEMLGFSSLEELQQRNLEEEGFEPEYPRAFFKEKIEKEGVIIGLESAWKRRNGTTIYIRESARAVRDPETGKVLYYEGVVEDITEKKRAELALQEQVEFLRQVIDSIDHPFYVINAETYEIEQANQALLQGRTLPPGTTCHEFTHRSPVPCAERDCLCPLDLVRESKEPAVVEHILYDKEGKEHIVEVHGHPVFDKEGNVVRMIEYTIDITPRKKLENALSSLAQSYAHLTGKAFLDVITRHIAKSMNLDVVYVGELLPSGEAIRILSVYGQPAEGTTYTLEHTPCANVVNQCMVVYPRDVQSLFPLDETLKEWRVEGYIGTPLFDPKRRPLGIMVGLSTKPFEDPGLLKEYFQVFVDRVTAELLRMRADEALRESEERFRLLAESSLTGIYLIQDGKFIYVNQALAEIFGYQVEEIVHKLGPLDLTHPEDRPLVQENIQRRMKGEIESIRYEFRGVRKDGTTIHLEVHGGRILYRGKPGIIGTLVDITERKRAEEEIERSHQLLMALSQAAQEVQRARSPEEIYRIIGERLHELGFGVTIFELDESQTHLRVVHMTFTPKERKIFEKAFGQPAEDIRIPIRPGGLYHRLVTIGKPVFIAIEEFVEEESWHLLPIFDQLARELGWEHNIIAPLKTPDKILGFLWVSGKGLSESDLRVISIFANQAAIALENTRLYRQTQELATFNQRIIENVADGIVIQNQEGVFTFVNPSAARILGHTVQELLGKHAMDVVPDDQRSILEKLQKRRTQGMTDRYELDLLRKDGTRIHALISATPLFDDQGQFVGSLSVFTDITALKKAEEEKDRLQEQLFQAQKLEAIGRLAGGIAHDFNNILTAIMGHAEMGLIKSHPDDPLYENLKEILAAANHSAELTSQLLGFARKQTILPKVLNLNQVISGQLKTLKRLIGEDVDLKWIPGSELWNVQIDPNQVEQILTNLMVNAKDAGAKIITIETANVTIDEAYLEKRPYFKTGEYVLMAVSDDGCGMDEDTLQHIFEPFFTTKEPEKGTGLGLSTVYGIVKQNHGFIHVYSEVGEGTTFKIYLPRYTGKARDQADQRRQRLAPGKGETILVVEDEENILKVVKTMLEQLGYRVLTAGRPSQAIQIAKSHQGNIDLLLTDVIMPEMSGKELADHLTQRFPRLKVLYMSGYTANHISNHGVLEPGVAFVSKPLKIQDLAMKIREVLDREPA